MHSMTAKRTYWWWQSGHIDAKLPYCRSRTLEFRVNEVCRGGGGSEALPGNSPSVISREGGMRTEAILKPIRPLYLRAWVAI
jgi:hypothetical protein